MTELILNLYNNFEIGSNVQYFNIINFISFHQFGKFNSDLIILFPFNGLNNE